MDTSSTEEEATEVQKHIEIKVDTSSLNEDYFASLVRDSEFENGETFKVVEGNINGISVPLVVAMKAGKPVDLKSYVTSYEDFTPAMLNSKTYKLIEEGLATDGISASETALKKAEELLERLESAERTLRWSAERSDSVKEATYRADERIDKVAKKLLELERDADQWRETIKKQEVTGEAKRSLAVYRNVLEITKDVFGEHISGETQAKAIEAASYAAWRSYDA
jgi:hypothetical protein